MSNYKKNLNKRGTINVEVNNHIYNAHRRKESIQYWKCQNRKCKSIGFVNKQDKLIFLKPNNHNNQKNKFLKKN